jgi:hypothetical protein
MLSPPRSPALSRKMSACFRHQGHITKSHVERMLFTTKVVSTKSHDELMFSPPGSPALSRFTSVCFSSARSTALSRMTSACFFATKVASSNILKPYFRSFDVTSLANHREGANNIACNRTQVFAFLMKRFVTAKSDDVT